VAPWIPIIVLMLSPLRVLLSGRPAIEAGRAFARA
jgi:hypothetical protein